MNHDIMVLISNIKHINKINSMLSLSSKALYCTSSKCANRKTTPGMVSSSLDFTEKVNFQRKSKLPNELDRHSRKWKPLPHKVWFDLFINTMLLLMMEV